MGLDRRPPRRTGRLGRSARGGSRGRDPGEHDRAGDDRHPRPPHGDGGAPRASADRPRPIGGGTDVDAARDLRRARRPDPRPRLRRVHLGRSPASVHAGARCGDAAGARRRSGRRPPVAREPAGRPVGGGARCPWGRGPPGGRSGGGRDARGERSPEALGELAARRRGGAGAAARRRRVGGLARSDLRPRDVHAGGARPARSRGADATSRSAPGRRGHLRRHDGYPSGDGPRPAEDRGRPARRRLDRRAHRGAAGAVRGSPRRRRAPSRSRETSSSSSSTADTPRGFRSAFTRSATARSIRS